MSDIDVSRTIDPEAALRSIREWIYSDDPLPRTFFAAALVHLDCGHVRPVNLRLDAGDEFACLLCGPARVVELELIETTDFPCPDSLSDLEAA